MVPISPRDKEFDFRGLFTFEMANNHQGSVSHGKRITNAIVPLVRDHEIKAAIKFQFRNLDTFIHPYHREKTDNKHIPRFLSTRLTEEQFGEMADEARKAGLITMATPFDEDSVDMAARLGIEVLKIASCSANDWPLLEKIADANKPVICSTGGLHIKSVDKIVSFFQHRGVHFALMHCVAMYPTPNEKLNLNRISAMKKRYPGVVIGFSTHEEPDGYGIIKMAYAKGAEIFERHVGVPDESKNIKLNAYSSTPEQAAKWLASYKEAVRACGSDNLPPIDPEEEKSLKDLARGVYLNRDIKTGMSVARENVYFAMPVVKGQLTSGEWHSGVKAFKDFKAHDPLPEQNHTRPKDKREVVYSTIHAVKGLLNEAQIHLGHDFEIELSHHYGLERLPEIGAVLIDCINREYCKKLIVQLPGQKHPYHYHKRKEETFQVLHGKLEIEIEGTKKDLYPGDVFTVHRGVWHNFKTPTGVVFEEVSTTHYPDDSFYEDKDINTMPREARKTKLVNWGRHQFD